MTDKGRLEGRIVSASERIRPFGRELDGAEGRASEMVDDAVDFPPGARIVTTEDFRAQFDDSSLERHVEDEEEEEHEEGRDKELEDRDMMGRSVEGVQTTEAVGPQQTTMGDVPSSSSIVMVRRGRAGRFQRLEAERSTFGGASTSRGQGGRDNRWLLSTAAPGGPMVLDVIPSLGGHLDFGLWSDPLKHRGVLKYWTRGQSLTILGRWRMSDEMWVAVEVSGLDHLREFLPHHLDMPLLTAFIER